VERRRREKGEREGGEREGRERREREGGEKGERRRREGGEKEEIRRREGGKKREKREKGEDGMKWEGFAVVMVMDVKKLVHITLPIFLHLFTPFYKWLCLLVLSLLSTFYLFFKSTLYVSFP
jgi:hypothetical protein